MRTGIVMNIEQKKTHKAGNATKLCKTRQTNYKQLADNL